MSNHTNKDILYNNLLLNRHIGGQGDPQLQTVGQHISDQLKILKDGNRYLPPNSRYSLGNNQNVNNRTGYNPRIQYANPYENNPYATDQSFSNYNDNGYKPKHNDVYLRNDADRHDPYAGYLYSRGLMSDGYQRRRYISKFVDINSVFRRQKPIIETEEPVLLNTDPLRFTNKSNVVFVSHADHGYEINDPITLTGVVSRNSILRTFRGTNLPTFEIPAGCNFMKIYYTHRIPLDYTGNTVMITLSGIKGDRGSSDQSSFLGSIPTNVINNTHSIKMTLTNDDIRCNVNDIITRYNDPNYFTPSSNYFFIILPVSMQNPINQAPYTLRDYNFRLLFDSLVGIPLNQLNARYPVDPDHLYGYHIIKSITNDGYTIELPTNAVVNVASGQFAYGGGNCIYVAKITSISTGYSTPNQYKIGLGNVYHNVISVRLVSSEIPNTEKAIRDETVGNANNKLYWNDIDDGEYLYSISIPPGNYSPADLITTIQNAFLATPRVNAITEEQRQALGITYTSRHFVQMGININTDEVIFKSFKEFILNNPIVEVDPDIPDSSTIQVDPNTTYTITLNHPNHGMTQAGQTILIQNAINHKGIPASAINGERVVTEILDENRYKVQLPKFNLLDDRTETGGGVNVFVYIPDFFRMRFDQEDTMGAVLGFRNPGDPTSITPFTNVVSNNNKYAFEPDTNSNGQTIAIRNNSLQLSGDNYIIMVINPLKTFYSLGKIKDAFAKIILCDSPGRILYNTFVPMVHIYEDPLHELYELDVSFYSPDGSLFNFNGVDHSYTLEIVTVNDIPEGTGINASTGKNYNQEIQ